MEVDEPSSGEGDSQQVSVIEVIKGMCSPIVIFILIIMSL